MKSRNCARCGKNPRMEGIGHCRQCLCAVIEKRAKREIASARSKRSYRSCYRLAVVCDNKSSLPCITAAYLAKKLCGPACEVELIEMGDFKLPGKVPEKVPEAEKEKTLNDAEDAAIIVPRCADDIAAEFMERFISPKISPKPSQQPISTINIFESVTEKELELYADIKSLKYARTKENDLKQRIQKLQARYPGTIEALARSGKRIEGLGRDTGLK